MSTTGGRTIWLDDEMAAGWASCAITENGFVRILGHPATRAPSHDRGRSKLLSRACCGGQHAFWPRDVSVLDARVVDGSRLHGPRQVTDACLLALAATHDGRLVTFDRSLSLASVPGVTDDHLTLL